VSLQTYLDGISWEAQGLGEIVDKGSPQRRRDAEEDKEQGRKEERKREGAEEAEGSGVNPENETAS
jgi:hypothetical protein